MNGVPDAKSERLYAYQQMVRGGAFRLAMVTGETKAEWRMRPISRDGALVTSGQEIRVYKASMREAGSMVTFWCGFYTLGELGRRLAAIRKGERAVEKVDQAWRDRVIARALRAAKQIERAVGESIRVDVEVGLYKAKVPYRGRDVTAIYRAKPENLEDASGGWQVQGTLYVPVWQPDAEPPAAAPRYREERVPLNRGATVAEALAVSLAAMGGFGD